MDSKLPKRHQIQKLYLNKKKEEDEKISPENLNIPAYKRRQSEQVSSQETEKKTISNKEAVFHFYKSVLSQIQLALIVTDSEGKITYVNLAAQRLLNYSFDEMIAFNIQILLDSNSCQSIFTESNSEVKADILHKDKYYLKVRIYSSEFFDEFHQIRGKTLLINDITDSVYKYEKFEKMEQMILLGEIASGIAHEIRNPLAGIKLNVDVMEEISQDSQLVEHIRRIKKEVMRANDLLLQFFKFAQPHKPKQILFDVENLLQEILNLLKQNIQSKKVSIQLKSNPLTPNAYADEEQCRQIFFHIIKNALEAVENDTGLIKIWIHCDEIYKGKNKQTMIVTEINDNGCGIEPQNISKIFNPFYTSKYQSIGLGLSIAQRLINENNGEIKCEESRKGLTKIVVLLPTSL